MEYINLLLFVAFILLCFAVGGYMIERSECKKQRKERQQQQEIRKANQNNSDWQETYKLANRLKIEKMLREEI